MTQYTGLAGVIFSLSLHFKGPGIFKPRELNALNVPRVS